MPIDTTKCRKSKSGLYVITAKGRLDFAVGLHDPKPNKISGKIKYQLNLLVPPTHDLTLLKNEMGAVALANCNGDQTRAKKLVQKRFLDPNDKPQGGKPAGEEFEGWTLIRATSDYKPDVTYPNGDEMPNEEIPKELYSGRWASALVNAYWSSNTENPGVFIGLQGIQLLDHDDVIGTSRPKAEDEFEAVEGVEGAAKPSADQSDNKDVDSMFG